MGVFLQQNMKTNQEKIDRNRRIVIIAMAVITIVLFGAFWFQPKSISPVSEKAKEESTEQLNESSQELDETVTVKGSISLSFE